MNPMNLESQESRLISTTILPTTDAGVISQANMILKSGGIISFPTDTVYGVAARFDDPVGIKRLFEVKGRDFNKAIAVLIGEKAQLSLVTAFFSDMGKKLAEVFWPGALTLVVLKNPTLPDVLSSQATVGVRMPNNPFTLALLQMTGPLATTSANLSGHENPLTAQDVFTQLGGKIELILDGGSTPGSIPSTVVDCTGHHPVILRDGAISANAIQKALED